MGNCRRWPTSSAVDYWMRPAPQKTSSLSLSEQRSAPASGNTLCEGHERRRSLPCVSSPCMTAFGSRSSSILVSPRCVCMTSILDILARRTGHSTSLFVTRSEHLIPRMNRRAAGGRTISTQCAINRAF